MVYLGLIFYEGEMSVKLHVKMTLSDSSSDDKDCSDTVVLSCHK